MPRRLQVSLRDALGGEIPPGALNPASGRAAVRAMRGPGSRWPVETGFSKRAFFVDRVSERDVTIGNRARYAGYVEAGIPNSRTRNSCRDTLRAARARIIAAGEEAAVDERLAPEPTERSLRRLAEGRGAGLSQGQRRALVAVVRAHRTRERARQAEASRRRSAARARAASLAALARRLSGDA